MTIASEITRLQGAKSDIRQAIIDKGVSVDASLTIDDYACCIASIPSSPAEGCIDFLVVGGGGSGGFNSCTSYGAGGGGAGGFIECCGYITTVGCYDIVVGKGGEDKLENGGNSCAFGVVAYGGGAGACSSYGTSIGKSGGSGGGGSGYNCSNGGSGYVGQGNSGGYGITGWGGGGGGAGEAGCNAGNGSGRGGNGKCSCISGVCCWYAGGGGGGSGTGANGGQGGGGKGGQYFVGCDATYYGGGGGGAGTCQCNMASKGYQGIVIVRYKTDGSYGVHSANGGTKYTCGDYTIHCFTGNGTFCIVS